MHQAEFCFHHYIVSCPLGVRTGLTIPGDRSINQCRVDLMDGLKVKTILFQGPWDVILNEYVAFCSELVQYVNAGRVLK